MDRVSWSLFVGKLRFFSLFKNRGMHLTWHFSMCFVFIQGRVYPMTSQILEYLNTTATSASFRKGTRSTGPSARENPNRKKYVTWSALRSGWNRKVSMEIWPWRPWRGINPASPWRPQHYLSPRTPWWTPLQLFRPMPSLSLPPSGGAEPK